MSITLQPLSQQSTPELIADQLRVKILDGTFPPHHQLAEVELAKQLQVSRGPVREAMQRLIQEGLVLSERNRGVFVIEMDADDARDVYVARGAVEKAAALLVARRSNPDDLDAVESVLARLRESVSASWPEVVEIDLEFHTTIVDRSGSPRLQRMFRTLAAETRLCIARLEQFYPVRGNVVTEHEEILAAIRAGDEALVKTLIDAHMTEAAERLTRTASAADFPKENLEMTNLTISSIRAREVLDCRGLPTVQVDIAIGDGSVVGRADVPSGRSTGSNEAHEMRDGGSRFGGFGVLSAVANVNDILAPALVGSSVAAQRALDARLLELDGSADKSALGANALLGVSLAAARAAAAAGGRPLYRHLSSDAHLLPVPLVNLINGGKHASNDLDFQEFIVLPVGATSMLEALQISTEINLVLAGILSARFGKVALNTGDEGGFAPPISSPEQALEILHEAVDKSGWAHAISYGLDCAATHWYDTQTGRYTLDGQQLDRDQLIERYLRLIEDFGLVTIEDPLHEEDFEGFAELTAVSGVQIVGDDLFTTNSTRLAKGIELASANSLLWKVNQIGTLSEAWDAATLAFHNGFSVVVSERSGETEDPIIADLVVALGAGQIKTGAPVRGERTAKYNRLLQIEEELGSAARYAGDIFAGAVT